VGIYEKNIFWVEKSKKDGNVVSKIVMYNIDTSVKRVILTTTDEIYGDGIHAYGKYIVYGKYERHRDKCIGYGFFITFFDPVIILVALVVTLITFKCGRNKK
jgi:predicted acyltransferase (DUF342 family)